MKRSQRVLVVVGAVVPAAVIAAGTIAAALGLSPAPPSSPSAADRASSPPTVVIPPNPDPRLNADWIPVSDGTKRVGFMKGAEVRTQRPVIAEDESSGRLAPSLHAIHEVYASEGDAILVGYFVDGLGYFDKATAEAKGFDIDALAEGRTPATFAPQAKP